MIFANVVNLAALPQVTSNDLIAVEVHPDHRHMGATIGVQIDEVRKR